jgi:hypothetical protein
MPIFSTNTASINLLQVTGSSTISGSSNVLTILGSGSTIFTISGSNGAIFSINDDSTSSTLFSVTSASINILSVDNSKNVSISGSLIVTGSITGSFYGTASLANTASFSLNTFTNLKTARFEMGVSSTSAITTGAKGRKTVGYNGTIVGWKLVTDQSTTMTLDVWKANNSIPTVANSITGSAPISLSAAQLGNSTTLTGWTTSVSNNDVFIVNVNSNNNATYFSLELDIVLTNA